MPNVKRHNRFLTVNRYGNPVDKRGNLTTTVKVPGVGEFMVRSLFQKESYFPGEDGTKPGQTLHNKFTIFIIKDGTSVPFPFYGSTKDYESFKRIMNADDRKGALETFASEALSGFQLGSPQEVADEFGYTRPADANRVYRGLKNMKARAEALGLDEDQLIKISNHLNR